MKMRPGVLTDTSRVKPWPTEGEWTCFLAIPSYYSLCTFNKCLCKIEPFGEMFGWGEASEIIVLPQSCRLQDPDKFLKILFKGIKGNRCLCGF